MRLRGADGDRCRPAAGFLDADLRQRREDRRACDCRKGGHCAPPEVICASKIDGREGFEAKLRTELSQQSKMVLGAGVSPGRDKEHRCYGPVAEYCQQGLGLGLGAESLVVDQPPERQHSACPVGMGPGHPSSLM